MYINKNQAYKSALLGMFFWAMGAMISYFSSMYNISNNWSGLAMFILVGIPSGFITTFMISKIVDVDYDVKMLESIAIGLLVATFLDGIFINWVSQIYSTNVEGFKFGGAFVLWGVFAIYLSYFTHIWFKNK